MGAFYWAPWLERVIWINESPIPVPIGTTPNPQLRKEVKIWTVRLKNSFPTRKSHFSKTSTRSRTKRSSGQQRNKDESRERTDHLGRANEC
jgi:hypothetical protein